MKILNINSTNGINLYNTGKNQRQTFKSSTGVDSFQKISFKANTSAYNEKLLKRYINDFISNIQSAPEDAVNKTFRNVLKQTNISETLQNAIVNNVDKTNGNKSAERIMERVVNSSLNNREKYSLFDTMKFAYHSSALYPHALEEHSFVYDRNEIGSLNLIKTDLWEKAKKQPEIFMVFKPLEKKSEPVTVESTTALRDKVLNVETRANKLLDDFKTKLQSTFLPQKRSLLDKVLHTDNYSNVREYLTYEHKYDFGRKLLWQAMDETLDTDQFRNLAQIMPREVFNAYSSTDEKFIQDTAEFFIKNQKNKDSFSSMARSFGKRNTYSGNSSSSEVHQGWFDYSDWP